MLGAKKLTMQDTVNIFFSYSRQDERFLDELNTHLSTLKRDKRISIWADSQIEVGSDWSREIQRQLDKADVIIVLVSSDYLTSKFAYEIELKRAIERHQRKEAIVLPIILRYCLWQDSILGGLQVLPRDGEPIVSRSRISVDEAYVEIVRGIRLVIDNILENRKEDVQPKTKDRIIESLIKLEDVYVTSGIPNLTFVEPEEFNFIKHALLQKGRGLVIEGPSGIGKTTVVVKVLENLQRDFTLLSARISNHITQIENINEWHQGIVVIDDFHRLSETIQNHLADYLKFLADYGDKNKKLIIVGIPNTGDTLIRISFDLANRITIFKLKKAKEEEIDKLINKGEVALNIEFKQRSSIVRESFGSLYIAQLLCTYIAIINNVHETQKKRIKIDSGIFEVTNRILQDLSPKFNDSVRLFAAIGNRRDRTCIELLKELAIIEDGVLNIYHLKAKRPELKIGITKLIYEKKLQEFYKECPDCKRHLLFDERIPALIIDDPQFKFYLNNISVDSLASLTGKSTASRRTKVFISYSHSDDYWLQRVMLHLKHLEKDGLIDLWVDSRINSGQNWRDEITKALDASKVAILLLSQNFIASDFIVDNELPSLLQAANNDEALIIQLVLKPCSIDNLTELTKFQMVNNPNQAMLGLTEFEQEKMLVKLAKSVESALGEDI